MPEHVAIEHGTTFEFLLFLAERTDTQKREHTYLRFDVLFQWKTQSSFYQKQNKSLSFSKEDSTVYCSKPSVFLIQNDVFLEALSFERKTYLFSRKILILQQPRASKNQTVTHTSSRKKKKEGGNKK